MTLIRPLAAIAALLLSTFIPAQAQTEETLPVEPQPAEAQPAEPAPDFTVPFASYGSDTLCLDIYMPADTLDSHLCVIFSYGGGFIDNNQRAASTSEFCRALADEGFVAVASDYRLGLKGVKMKSTLGMAKYVDSAIQLASEDIFKATAYVLENAVDLKVRPDGIILCGSSAGAITSLQCDYELCNRTPIACILPEEFHYAGIISFAGAVFSKEGRCDYRVHSPAPTLMLHGMSDKLVNYNKIAFFNTRFSGSNDLQKRFAKYGWSHEIIRFVDEGHGVAGRMMENFEDVMWFIENMVIEGRRFEIDKTVNDRDFIRSSWDSFKPENLY